MSEPPAIRISESNGRVRFGVRIQPRASRNELVGEYGEAIKIRLAAPPVDGAANDSLVIFLSETFAVSRSSIMIVSGVTSRSKTIEIAGVTERAVRNVIAGLVKKP